MPVFIVDIKELTERVKEANYAKVTAQAKVDEAVSKANIAEVSICSISIEHFEDTL